MWTRHVAEFIVNCDTGSAPREIALQPLADTLGCLVSGLPSPAGHAALRYAGLDDGATLADLWGTAPRLVDVEMRAVVGGTLGASIDYDDVSSNGHPSAILVAAILSVDDGPRLDGEALLDAYLVGYEVSAKVGDMFHLPHSRHGWHTTSTAGTFGAAAAVCRLYGFDVGTTLNALGIAASMAAGIGRNFGTMTKPLHSGLAARNGIQAARLARAGVTAADDVLEGPRGFVDMYGLGQGDLSVAATLGKPWAMEDRLPSLKKYPSCYTTHRVIDAMLELQNSHNFNADDVEAIIVRAPTKSTASLVYDRPRTGLEGKFSAHYVTAAAFQDRTVNISSFSDSAVSRPDIGALIDKIDFAEDPLCRPEDPDAVQGTPIAGGFWEVTVRTTNGIQAKTSSTFPPGGPERPLGWSDIEEKFYDCTNAAGHDAVAAASVFSDLKSLEAVSDVRDLLDRLGARAT